MAVSSSLPLWKGTITVVCIDKEIDDMDPGDWIDFIDEYHCPDYWDSCDYDPNDDPCCGYDEPDDEDEDDWDDESHKCGAD